MKKDELKHQQQIDAFQQKEDEKRQHMKELIAHRKESFLIEHPQYQGLSKEEINKAFKQNLASRQHKKRKVLKEHIEFFSDAVIAIIITIMVLEIPIPGEGESYYHVIYSIGTFFISFFIVAYFWRYHHRILERVEECNETILFTNFVFLALVSLIPLFTKWMMESPTGFAVANYGVVYLATFIVLNILEYFVLKVEKGTISMLFTRLLLFKLFFVIIINIVQIVFSYFHPLTGRWLYAFIPILTLLLTREESKEFDM